MEKETKKNYTKKRKQDSLSLNIKNNCLFLKTASGFNALDMDLSPGLLSGLAQTSLLAYKDPPFHPSLLFMRNCLEDKHASWKTKMLKIYTHVEKCLFSPFSLYHRRVLFVITILHSPNSFLPAASSNLHWLLSLSCDCKSGPVTTWYTR